MARLTGALGAGGTSLVNVVTTNYLEKEFLDTLWDNLLIVGLGKKSTLPNYMGTTVRWQIPTALTAIVAIITNEGDDPGEEALATTTFEATLEEYGRMQTYTKALMSVGLSATHEMIVREMGQQAALSFETLTVQEVDDAATGLVDSGVAMTADSIRLGVRALRINKAKPHPNTPGGKFYCVVLHPDQFYDMIGEGAPTWFQAKSRDVEATLTSPLDQTPATSALYGAIIKVSDSIQNVSSEYRGIALADESFGVASLDTDATSPRVIITRPEELVSAPARNRGSVAWWGLFAAKRFGDAKTIVIKSDI